MNRAEIIQRILIGRALAALPKRLLAAPKTESSPRSILIIPQLTRIGDLVCTTPVFRALKEALPGVEIDVLVTNKSGPILQGNPFIRKRIRYSTAENSETLRGLLAGKYDWCIDYTGSSLGSALAVLARIPHLVRLARHDETFVERMIGSAAEHVFLYRDHAYLPNFYCSMLAPLGVPNQMGVKKELFFKDEEKQAARTLLAQAGFGSKKIVALSLSAGNSIKEWGDDRFAQLAVWFATHYSCAVAVVGGPHDAARVSRFVARLRAENQGVTLAGFTDIPLDQLAAFFSCCGLLVAADTGSVHVAEAVGTPVIDIVGPVHPGEQAPQGERSAVVLPSPAVAPSVFAFDREGPDSRIRSAIENTSVEHVLSSAKELIRRSLT